MKSYIKELKPTFRRLFKKWQMLGKNKILTAAHCQVREDRNFIFNDADATFSTVSKNNLRCIYQLR